VVFADAYVSIQNAHSYSPQLYSTLSTDATLLKVIAEISVLFFCICIVPSVLINVVYLGAVVVGD